MIYMYNIVEVEELDEVMYGYDCSIPIIYRESDNTFYLVNKIQRSEEVCMEIFKHIPPNIVEVFKHKKKNLLVLNNKNEIVVGLYYYEAPF